MGLLDVTNTSSSNYKCFDYSYLKENLDDIIGTSIAK